MVGWLISESCAWAYIELFDMLMWEVVIPPDQQLSLLLVVLLKVHCGISWVAIIVRWMIVVVIVVTPVGAARLYHMRCVMIILKI